MASPRAVARSRARFLAVGVVGVVAGLGLVVVHGFPGIAEPASRGVQLATAFVVLLVVAGLGAMPLFVARGVRHQAVRAGLCGTIRVARAQLERHSRGAALLPGPVTLADAAFICRRYRSFRLVETVAFGLVVALGLAAAGVALAIPFSEGAASIAIAYSAHVAVPLLGHALGFLFVTTLGVALLRRRREALARLADLPWDDDPAPR